MRLRRVGHSPTPFLAAAAGSCMAAIGSSARPEAARTWTATYPVVGTAVIPSSLSAPRLCPPLGVVLECRARESAMVTLSETEYRDRVLGAWLGKLIGGALGAPLDGRRQTQEVAGYPEPPERLPTATQQGTDFQLAWLRALQMAGPHLVPDDLVMAWLKHLVHARSEFAYARANFRRDVEPPVSGVFDNPFREALGGVARADLWGIIAPGDPERAASYALQDAMLDHAGPGVQGALFLAAVVSAAFVEPDVSRLVEVGLGLLPEDARVARAVRDVSRWHGEHAHWARTREMLLRAYASEDLRDSTICTALIALSLLHGKGDFGLTLATAARCGWSTLATCAAAGAVLGALLGAPEIPDNWRQAIRGELTAGCDVVGLPRTTRASLLAEHTAEIGRLVIRSESVGRVHLSEEPPDEPSKLSLPEGSALIHPLSIGPYVNSYRRGPLEIHIDYGGRPTIGYDVPRRLTVAIANTATRSLDLKVQMSAPSGFVVTTGSGALTLPEDGSVSFTLTISAPQEHAEIAAVNPCTLFLSVDDGSELTVPITLVGEALWYAAGPYGDFEEAHAPEQPGILAGDTPLSAEGWQRLSVAEPAVNLLADLESERGTHYAATDFFVPRLRQARLRVACNDGTKVWLNAQEVFLQHEHRPVSPLSADEFEVALREGWNRLVIKMAQCSPRRFLAAALKDLDGQLLVEAVNALPRPRPAGT